MANNMNQFQTVLGIKKIDLLFTVIHLVKLYNCYSPNYHNLYIQYFFPMLSKMIKFEFYQNLKRKPRELKAQLSKVFLTSLENELRSPRPIQSCRSTDDRGYI